MVDKFKDECGVFGIYGHPEASKLTYLGLYALQHRGQESAGHRVGRWHADPRVEGDGVRQRSVRRRHDRAAARSAGRRARPLLNRWREPAGQRAADRRRQRSWPASPSAHNGNLVNAGEVRDALVRDGAIFQTNSDTEVVVHLFARAKADGAEAAIVEALIAGPRRLLAGDDDEGPPDRRPRSAWIQAARHWPARRRVGDLLRNVRDGPDRGHLSARCRTRRGRHRRSVRAQVGQAVSAGATVAMRVRARVFLASGQLRVRRERQRGSHGVRPAAGA